MQRKYKNRRIFALPTHAAARKLVPAMRFGETDKIKGTVELQRICLAFSVPFEPAKLYERNSKFLPSDIKGADRLLFRSETNRMEYVVKGASPEILNKIPGFIKRLINGKVKVIVQKVGLRQDIESYGSIAVNSKKIQYYEKQHNSDKASEQDVFLLGQAQLGSDLKPLLEFEGNKLSPDAGKFIDEKLGSQNAHEMVGYVQSKIENGYKAMLRFVKYKGKKQCFFYDMTVRQL